MATRLFVGNLPDNISETDIRSAFSSYGEITNLDLKSKSATPSANENKKFAFVTIAGSNHDIETCIRYFSNQDFNGNRLYVTRARESFLERLQRERLEAQKKETDKNEEHKIANETPVLNLGDKLNPRKRKTINEPITNHKPKSFDTFDQYDGPIVHEKKLKTIFESDNDFGKNKVNKKSNASFDKINKDAPIKETNTVIDKKKQDSDYKRLEAMKKKSQEFKQKKMILKTGLTGVDKVPNKKIKFSDDEEELPMANGHEKKKIKSDNKPTLFDDDDDDSGNELNFEIKKQFEGVKGQKVLDLQSRYKSDKRFVLDERFIEDDEQTEENQETPEEDKVELGQTDEKTKQLNILENVLGVSIWKKVYEEDKEGKKNKPKLGMLRFDPSQPEHAKFLAPVDDKKQESTKKIKKKKETQPEVEVPEPKPEEPRPEVSKEQFYKISDTLKEAIAQPTSFSLRSLFGNTEETGKETQNENADYIALQPPKKSKVKNPLEPGEKNPFVYDSSESENEDIEENEQETKSETAQVASETKAVWRESFFFGHSDQRFDEGISFFTTSNEETHKERRELKSLMKKRIYNRERKDEMQMFKKKIGGRKKVMKKSFRRKN